MACNKMIWALVGLCVLSLSMTLSVAAPADQADDQADPAAGQADPADGQADPAADQADPAADQADPADNQAGDQADQTGDQADQADDQAGQADDQSAQAGGRSNPLANAVYEVVGIVIQTFLNKKQVGNIFKRLPEDVRVTAISGVDPNELKNIIKEQVTPEQAALIIKAISKQGKGQDIFGDDFEKVKSGTKEEQLQAIINLEPESLGKLSEFDTDALLGAIINAVQPDEVGKIVAANLDAFIQVLEPNDIKVALKGLVQLFFGGGDS